MLPPELMDLVLANLDGRDLATLRAVSQTSRHLEQRLARLQPLPFQQAHVKTLEKAFALKTMNVANPRNARLLAAMTELYLLEKGRGWVSLPPRAQKILPANVLRRVAGALPPVRSLTLGSRALDLSLYTGLVGAGLDTSALTSLNLEQCGCIAPEALDRLSGHFAQLQHLTTLRFPAVLAPRHPVHVFGDPARPHYDFGPLAALETTLPADSAVHLKLPDAPLVRLRLGPLHLGPQGGNPFAQKSWQASLRQLSLGAIISQDTLDLSNYTALERLTLTHDGFDLRRLRLPAPQGLTKLRISGQHPQHLLDQMATASWPALTFFQLSVAVGSQETLSIPWRRMPNVLRFGYEYKGRWPLELGCLNIPRQNHILRLDLKGRYLTHRLDPTFRDLPLPRLQQLDLANYRLTRPFVRQLALMLQPTPAWPKLRRIILHRQEPRSDLKKMLCTVAHAYGLEIAWSP
jgi:hypothetical protein